MVSFWEKETFFAPHEIVIIGSGFTGLWCAIQLKKKQPKLKISIIERGIIPTGASTRNAGFACFGSLSELIYDGQTMGIDKMLQLVEMRFKGLERIRKFYSDKEIDFDLCGGYELYDTSDQISADQLSTNIGYINSLLKTITKSKQTFKRVDAKIDGFGFGKTKHLIKNSFEGQLHSGKLLQALLRTVQAMGVQVFTNTEVTNYKRVNSQIEISTNQSFSLQTKQLLICTNAFSKNLLPEVDIIPARGQILVTSPIEHLPWKGTFHSDEGFYYFRNLGNRVLVGGARNTAFKEEESFEFITTDLIQNNLEQYLNEVILPKQEDKFSIEYRWSGIMAMGSEKLPIIKEVEPDVFCAVRMSGMGVALAPVIGQTIAGMML